MIWQDHKLASERASSLKPDLLAPNPEPFQYLPIITMTQASLDSHRSIFPASAQGHCLHEALTNSTAGNGVRLLLEILLLLHPAWLPL